MEHTFYNYKNRIAVGQAALGTGIMLEIISSLNHYNDQPINPTTPVWYIGSTAIIAAGVYLLAGADKNKQQKLDKTE